ncbi:hypothetical protein RQ831_04135 [Roseomonas gilardii]|uniref:DUF4145 domain-containing protein n=1 Tax=Roseomonas gilardii TaxID=257708 RepID=A0ABU3MBK6_9PROT|nr:hypothetical protein [Roseomonas gilardii]MDT8330230.1 hypothetical protein [Roseomonas gilardii]
MSSNLSKYESDLTNLVEQGTLLFNAMQYEVHKKEVEDEVKKVLGDKANEYIKKLPKFTSDYQHWYSEAKSLIKQIIPDRLDDFVRHYERQVNRKALQWDNYTIEDYLQGLVSGEHVTKRAGLARMEQQLSILRSAKQRFLSSLFDIRQLAMADIFDDEIEAARLLLKNKFYRAAGAMAGVIMEKHLSQVCQNHNIKVSKKNPTISDLNDLLKSENVIDVTAWRKNQYLGDIRNLCDHNKKQEPTSEQVSDLIDGVAKILKTIF